jgi:hypothetical protein
MEIQLYEVSPQHADIFGLIWLIINLVIFGFFAYFIYLVFKFLRKKTKE